MAIESPPRGKKHFTPEKFGLLLDKLHSDRERAGEEYLLLWNKLLLYFQTRKCPVAHELVDIALIRTAEKLGTNLEIRDIRAFSMGVAKNIWKEYLANLHKNPISIDDLDFYVPAKSSRVEYEIERRQRIACLEKCLRLLPKDDAELCVGYFIHDEGSNKDIRRMMANTRGISSQALRLRVMRIRHKLEELIEQCMEKNSTGEK